MKILDLTILMLLCSFRNTMATVSYLISEGASYRGEEVRIMLDFVDTPAGALQANGNSHITVKIKPGYNLLLLKEDTTGVDTWSGKLSLTLLPEDVLSLLFEWITLVL